MANITGNWNKNMPSGDSLVADGDDLMRQHWGALEDTIEEEHYMTDSVKSAGMHKPGSSVVSYGNESSVKSTPLFGRLFYATDSQSLYITGPSGRSKISGAQQGGPVRSSNSGVNGWYICSYLTQNKAARSHYSYYNSFGNPMTFLNIPVMFGPGLIDPYTSTSTHHYSFLAESLTSRSIRGTCIISNDVNIDSSDPAEPFHSVCGASAVTLQIAVMGLLPVSELS